MFAITAGKPYLAPIHVIKRGDQWAVKKPEMSRATRLCPTKESAIEWAMKWKRRVVVHNADGTVEKIIEA